MIPMLIPEYRPEHATHVDGLRPRRLMEDFVSEPLTPDPGSFDTAAMARGEPGLPTGFTWRERHYVIGEVLEAWKTCGRDGESVYLRRHWFRLRAGDGTVLTIYCQRQATRASAKNRWWVYSVAGS